MSVMGPESARYQALIQLLRTAEDLWNSSRTFFARWNLSPSQFNVLNLLFGQIDGLSQSELSRLLIMHRSNATGLIDRLERRQLVLRTEDANDRRAYRVVLTQLGIQLLESIYPHYYAAAEQVWIGISEDRVEPLLLELRELAVQATRVAVRSTLDGPSLVTAESSPGPDGPVAQRRIPRKPRPRRTSPATPRPGAPSEASAGWQEEGPDNTLRTTDL